MSMFTALISKKTYNILTSPSELVSFSDTCALLLIYNFCKICILYTSIGYNYSTKG